MILILKHIGIEGPGTLGDFLEQNNWQTKTIELENGEALPSLDDCEAIISLGGPMNVYEEEKYHFLKDEDKFFKKAINKEIPILGICLGAQILAKACGAKVKKAPSQEVGWYKVDLTDKGRADSLFDDCASELTVFQWHEDTFEAPKESLLLAESNSCPNQAFKVGRCAYGLQFHVEVTAQIIESWINEYIKEEDRGINSKNMLIDAYKRQEAYKRQARLVYLNFARIIKESQERRKIE